MSITKNPKWLIPKKILKKNYILDPSLKGLKKLNTTQPANPTQPNLNVRFTFGLNGLVLTPRYLSRPMRKPYMFTSSQPL